MKRWYAALNVDFLLALAAGEENAELAIEMAQQIQGCLIVTPSVLQELADIINNGSTDPEAARLAKLALSQLNHWGVTPPTLTGTEHGIADVNAHNLLSAGLFSEYQSAIILAEASGQNCSLLFSYRPALSEVEMNKLKLQLLGAGLTHCLPMQPLTFTTHLARSLMEKPQKK